jgi:hypothetical protein
MDPVSSRENSGDAYFRLSLILKIKLALIFGRENSPLWL